MKSRRLDELGNYHYDRWELLTAYWRELTNKEARWENAGWFWYEHGHYPRWNEWPGFLMDLAKMSIRGDIEEWEWAEAERRYFEENPEPPDPEGDAKDFAAMQEAFRLGSVPGWWLKGEAKQ